jgi:hypothetical protein
MDILSKMQEFINENPNKCEEIKLYHYDKDKWSITVTWSSGFMGFDGITGTSLEEVFAKALHLMKDSK